MISASGVRVIRSALATLAQDFNAAELSWLAASSNKTRAQMGDRLWRHSSMESTLLSQLLSSSSHGLSNMIRTDSNKNVFSSFTTFFF